MLSSGLNYFTEIPMVVFALLLFVAAFAAITWRTYFRNSSKDYYVNVAELPLKEEGHG